MPATRLSLKIEQGTTWRNPPVIWQQPADSPVDLTGWTARMQIRKSVSATTVLAELTTDNGCIVLGGADGSIELLLSAEQTAALKAGAAVYDLEMVSPGGEVTRLLEGSVSVSPEVTR